MFVCQIGNDFAGGEMLITRSFVQIKDVREYVNTGEAGRNTFCRVGEHLEGIEKLWVAWPR